MSEGIARQSARFDLLLQFDRDRASQPRNEGGIPKPLATFVRRLDNAPDVGIVRANDRVRDCSPAAEIHHDENSHLPLNGSSALQA